MVWTVERRLVVSKLHRNPLWPSIVGTRRKMSSFKARNERNPWVVLINQQTGTGNKDFLLNIKSVSNVTHFVRLLLFCILIHIVFLLWWLLCAYYPFPSNFAASWWLPDGNDFPLGSVASPDGWIFEQLSRSSWGIRSSTFHSVFLTCPLHSSSSAAFVASKATFR